MVDLIYIFQNQNHNLLNLFFVLFLISLLIFVFVIEMMLNQNYLNLSHFHYNDYLDYVYCMVSYLKNHHSLLMMIHILIFYELLLLSFHKSSFLFYCVLLIIRNTYISESRKTYFSLYFCHVFEMNSFKQFIDLDWDIFGNKFNRKSLRHDEMIER